MAGGAIPTAAPQLAGGYLTGRALIYPLSLVISLFFLWGFSYGLLDVLNKHFQTVLGITKLESTGLQVMYFGGGYLLFSPVAAEVLKRRGYKLTILMGLALYSLGAVLFWPVAKSADSNANGRAVFGGFCACTLVIACGLATLETAANSTLSSSALLSLHLLVSSSASLGTVSRPSSVPSSPPSSSSPARTRTTSTNVQYVYLAVACAGAAVGVLFFFAKLPEVSEAVLEEDQAGHVAQGSIWKQWNMWFAFGAQFCYVGAQVTIATFFINYAHENGDITTAKGSNMLSYALITFTVGRFVATGLAVIFSSEFIMRCSQGVASVGILIAVFFFMAPMYPTIFAMGTRNLGHTLDVLLVSLSWVYRRCRVPPCTGAIADAKGTRISYIVPTIGFVYVLGYVAVSWVSRRNYIYGPQG
ncbi:hypothetical protein AU210_016789 [Fusarium oxysporum f. sp. radicis-cucumerinum]|uniref:MFS transporter, FHS family, L-fucose permease n=1 Tax=Fusarium oxysporum f. sp. radicis-cucumerinum TaxID=327505 RepID=A0A2H3FWD5_FUSOX|nr:hypothetical protein AU210_016789 [Fusarium oxysporum f. sp. radicis-cucumerinum]